MTPEARKNLHAALDRAINRGSHIHIDVFPTHQEDAAFIESSLIWYPYEERALTSGTTVERFKVTDNVYATVFRQLHAPTRPSEGNPAKPEALSTEAAR